MELNLRRQHGITDLDQISQLARLSKRVIQQYIDLLPDKIKKANLNGQNENLVDSSNK